MACEILFSPLARRILRAKLRTQLVSKKIKEIIKNHVSLKREIIEIHWKNNGF